MTEHVKYYARAILLPLLLMAAVTYGAGEAILAWPTGEAGLSRSLAADRTSLWNTLTDYGTSLSDTPYIVALTAIAAILFRLLWKRWLESAFLIVAVWSQSLVFLATTEVVGRHRPPVQHLDPAPPTSSFPSGHVSAAVAFYCGLALVLSTHVRNRALQVLIWVLGVAAPLIVAFSRMYRGMHFFTDVTWGLLLGVACVIVAARAILYRRERQERRREVSRPVVAA
ncbi:phosphatase PAP2 family protein [Actinomadura sp. ATCC 31491]|uniref:Phosphatase PAP2 family protein n=1 Tax=Actinomadura luzonensis TaxID=2805427 RepID=A0ABT0FJJ9_9ACTN|nr:phosphatase PAP2 family protein [Actinomadura luzonensis]MCK2212235.1 phosphatase PAP2 family protein [Actinomadura luzonensis]